MNVYIEEQKTERERERERERENERENERERVYQKMSNLLIRCVYHLITFIPKCHTLFLLLKFLLISHY